MVDALANPTEPPKQRLKYATGPKNNFWHRMTPEERKAYSAKIRAKRDPANMKGRVGRKPGVPQGWHYRDYELACAAARKDVKRIMQKMADEGMLPEDAYAREALEGAVQVLREPGTKETKLKAARLILDFTKSKPASKSDVTIRTAESFLDELAAQDDPDDDASAGS